MHVCKYCRKLPWWNVERNPLWNGLFSNSNPILGLCLVLRVPGRGALGISPFSLISPSHIARLFISRLAQKQWNEIMLAATSGMEYLC